MTLSDLSIDRPILTWMMILALLVFGVLGYNRLGVDQFPNMEFPVLSVTSILDDATPEGIEEDVTDVLEEGFNTIAGVRKISSTSCAFSFFWPNVRPRGRVPSVSHFLRTLLLEGLVPGALLHNLGEDSIDPLTGL